MAALGPRSALKLELMFEGIRYSDAMGKAAAHSFPSFYPYRFAPGEHDPTGEGKATVPYMLVTRDGTEVRIKGSGESRWHVEGSLQSGYQLQCDGTDRRVDIEFEPLPNWMRAVTSDGFPMARAGLELHGDMAVVNVAPGCEYFLHKRDGVSMRCTFCAYGAPDKRTSHLGQDVGVAAVPATTARRIQETLSAALAENEIRHIYLVAGSMIDGNAEAERFMEVARIVQAVNPQRIPVSCGSGALPLPAIDRLHAEGLVDNVCFNLEVWSRDLFARVCPGKNHYVGYDAWIGSLEHAVSLWGKGQVYTAMVAGIELEPEYKLDWQAAADLAIAGAEDLCRRGIIPVYSLYWPVGGRDHPDYMQRLHAYFLRLTLGYHEIRQRLGIRISDRFMTRRCAYMQLECDVDHEST